jgi:hypothetical protein
MSLTGKERPDRGDSRAEDEVAENETDASSGGGKNTPDKAGKSGMPEEIGGPKGPEPTRFGDWEKDGRCSDF